MLDQGVSTLVNDLHQRGLDKDVSVVVWGEFGRTPVINDKGGRDHWPKVSCALLAGGGMNTGQVIGSTTRDGGEADDRPVTFEEVFATLYHNVGIDVSNGVSVSVGTDVGIGGVIGVGITSWVEGEKRPVGNRRGR